MSLLMWEMAMKPSGIVRIGVFSWLRVFAVIIELVGAFPLIVCRVLPLLHSRTIACWDLRTTITRALQQIACRIVVARPVRSGRRL